jgi:hypothetical protein
MPRREEVVIGIARKASTQYTIQPHKQKTLFHLVNQLIMTMKKNLTRGFGYLVKCYQGRLVHDNNVYAAT